MSYNRDAEQYKLSFSELDIAALQYLYGPSRKARTGDDTYHYDASAPNFIWDGAGVDTIDASQSLDSVTIFLEHGPPRLQQRHRQERMDYRPGTNHRQFRDRDRESDRF